MAFSGTNHKGGRPKGKVSERTRIAWAVKDLLAKKLEMRAGSIIDAQLDLAQGVQTEAFDRKNNKLIYTAEKPDSAAFRTVIEQVVGKPTESIEVRTPEDKPISILVELVAKQLDKTYGDD